MEDLMMNQKRRILVISISSWNTEVGMNTWPALLEGHDPDCVAHICFRSNVPNNPVCNHYFVLSEGKVIKSILNRKIKTGCEVFPGEGSTELSADLAAQKTRYQKLKGHRNAVTLLGRELLWKLGKWKTKELDDFVTSFAPDVILYSMESYLYCNRVCRYVKKLTGAKSIGYFADDNFTYKQQKGFFANLPRFFQRRSLKKLAKQTDAFFAITPKTKREADAFFGVDCKVLTKPLYNIPEVAYPQTIAFPIRLLYTGNLNIGRDESLLQVARAMQEINREEPKFALTVYTSTPLSEPVREALEATGCKLNDAIPQSAVLERQREADLLLFLEATKGKNAKIARLSFSTKITDYFSAGRCIFAVGCPDIAPVEYLRENDCALIAGNEEQMEKQLRRIAEAPQLLAQYAQNAALCAARNHEKNKVLDLFNNTIESVVNG